MKVLVIDNYDSFTYNLVHYVEDILNKKVDTIRNDKINIEDIEKYDALILSPGPKLPKNAGKLMEVIKTYHKAKKILGVCLGLQAIYEFFGGKLKNLEGVLHGISTDAKITKESEILFRELPQKIKIGRYHSWVADSSTIPDNIEITCKDYNNEIMAIRHKHYDICAVQFHPESVLTPFGKKIIENWLRS